MTALLRTALLTVLAACSACAPTPGDDPAESTARDAALAASSALATTRATTAARATAVACDAVFAANIAFDDSINADLVALNSTVSAYAPKDIRNSLGVPDTSANVEHNSFLRNESRGRALDAYNYAFNTLAAARQAAEDPGAVTTLASAIDSYNTSRLAAETGSDALLSATIADMEADRPARSDGTYAVVANEVAHRLAAYDTSPYNFHLTQDIAASVAANATADAALAKAMQSVTASNAAKAALNTVTESFRAAGVNFITTRAAFDAAANRACGLILTHPVHPPDH